MKIFKPDLIIDKYDDFDYRYYYKQGFDTILLDVDNTITPYFVEIPDDKAKAFVRELKECGFNVIVYSNNTDERVSRVAKSIDCDYVCWAFKPLPFKFNYAIKRFKLNKKKIIVMGDQLLTDTLGGNLKGLFTVYVRPISNKDSFTTAINRKIERFIFKYILHEKV